MIELASTVHLAPKARLRFDRHEQKQMILAPERGLVLSPSAAEIVEQCVDPRAVRSIVDALVARYGESRRDAITGDVLELLRTLADKGLVEETP